MNSTSSPPIEKLSSSDLPVKGHFSVMNAVQTVISVAVIMATLLTLWTPDNLFSNKLLSEMIFSSQSDQVTATEEIVAPTVTPQLEKRIGIVSGHYGFDSGAVCTDGLTEMDVNLRIATFVQKQLVEQGYEVDLLQEFDSRLVQYQALALISIHNDSCDYINDEATGFKVAAAPSVLYPEKAQRLTSCLIQRYGTTTRLKFHPNTITEDMTSYHGFNELNSGTTAAIIETGFLNLDRQILTESPEKIADGITAGILCYVRNEPVKPAANNEPDNNVTQDTPQP